MKQLAVENSYRLSLSGSCGWQLQAVPELESWLQQFCRIMELQKSNDQKLPLLRCLTEDRYGYDRKTLSTNVGTHNIHSIIQFPAVKLIFYNNRDIDAIICKEGIGSKTQGFSIEAMPYLLYPLHNQIISEGGLLMHAALAEHEGKAWLIAGKSGSGKTTCSNQLHGKWKSLCDDECLIVKNSSDGFSAWPLPSWNEFINNGNSIRACTTTHGFPLCGILYLEKGNDSNISSMNSALSTLSLYYAALAKCIRYYQIYDGIARKNINGIMLNNTDYLARQIPVYRINPSYCNNIQELLEKIAGII
ncbi:MAG: SynChlorMet cassette protein ScmC [Chlorobium sp.]|nr:MAG: SynChlorMet cassette protein ScmC [Chlorobium sp.]